MEQLFNLLALDLPDWEIPWAGIAAVLAGTGSLLTGIAALKVAQKQGAGNEVKTEKTDTRNSSGDES